MPAFSDTFTKDQQKDELLGYDDTAFYYFAGSVLLVIAIPWTFQVGSSLLFPGEKELETSFPKKNKKTQSVFKYCPTATMQHKMDEARKEARKMKGGAWTVLRVVILAIMWLCVWGVVAKIGNTGEIRSFDPFAILDVSSGSTDKEIKKAYRKLSLIYHPDKNPDDPKAAARFIQITKAYAALTDDVAKANYEKYGNPDGPTQAKVGIGLPGFLMDKDNHLIILALFFVVLLVVLPTVAILFYQRTKEYAPNGVMVETLQLMGFYINESTRAKMCSELLAASAESREIPLRDSDNACMKKLIDTVEEHVKRRWQKIPSVYKMDILLLAHMQRQHAKMNPDLLADLNEILKLSLKTTQSMIEIACAREWFWTAQAMIEFRVQLVQALDVKSSPLIQIPHFEDEAVKKFQRGKNAVTTLKQFLDQAPEDRKGLVDLKPQQLLDVDAFCKHLSVADIKTTVEVEDEAELVVGDIATVTVGLHRVNLSEGEAIGPVHAPFFPEPKFEEWWIFLCEAGPSNRIMSFERVRDWEKHIEVKMRFQISRPGKHEMVIHALCDSYSGLDLKSDIKFVAKTETEVNREIISHKEDEELELVPTLFQQMMGEIGKDDDSDEEEEEDGKKTDKKTANKDGPKKGEEKKDDDDDSSSSSSSGSSSDED